MKGNETMAAQRLINAPINELASYLNSPEFKADWKKAGTLRTHPVVKVKKQNEQFYEVMFKPGKLVKASRRVHFELTVSGQGTMVKMVHKEEGCVWLAGFIGLLVFIIPGLLMFLMFYLQRRTRCQIALEVIRLLEQKF